MISTIILKSKGTIFSYLTALKKKKKQNPQLLLNQKNKKNSPHYEMPYC